MDRVKKSFEQRNGFVLIQAATGAGKTIIFCSLIKELLEATPYLRIAVVAHRRELAAQARDKLLNVWPEAPIGLACSSLDKKSDLSHAVTIGTIQTLARQSKFTPFHIVIIDEVHRLPIKDVDSQFGQFLKDLLQLNPGLQVLGVTATPFRLGHGYIYGQNCKTPWANWFSERHYAIDIGRLQSEGFLCPYVYMVADKGLNEDLEQVQSGSFGDYKVDELEKVVVRQQHLLSAVKTLECHAAQRKGIIVFCVSISHADMIRDELLNIGIASQSVHSEMPIAERDATLKAFDDGELRVLTNVNVLTEGWDSPRADCVMLCRPTLSTALYVQMVGRGLRVHPQKKDCLVLDLAGCYARHGSVQHPIVRIAHEEADKNPVENKDKTCPECLEVIPLSEVTCPYCDRELKPCIVYLDDEQNMVRIDEDPDSMIMCEGCGKPHPYDRCQVEWMSHDIDCSTPGFLYCPEEHPIQALEAPYPLEKPGHYQVIQVKSKLSMIDGDMGLEISLLLLDERCRPCFISYPFSSKPEDQQRLADFVACCSDSELEEDSSDAFALPAKLNRRKWRLEEGIDFCESPSGIWPKASSKDRLAQKAIS